MSGVPLRGWYSATSVSNTSTIAPIDPLRQDQYYWCAILAIAKPEPVAQVSAADIKSEFFDGEPSESVAHDLRNRAQEAEGFGGRTGGDEKKKVYVDINEFTDKDLLEAAGMTTPNEKEEIEDKAKDEMDALINAQLVADGGRADTPPRCGVGVGEIDSIRREYHTTPNFLS